MVIRDDFLLKVTQIRFLNKKGESDGASGFFYRHSDGDLYLITNRHVVLDEAEDHAPEEIRLSLPTVSGHKESLKQSLYDGDDNPLWRESLIRDIEVDVVALPLKNEKIESYPLKWFTYADLIGANFDIPIGENVIVVGFPLGFYDDVNGLPIARSAMVASCFQVSYKGKPGFLIDSRLHRGSSGSPVLTNIDLLRRMANGALRYNPWPKKRVLVGVFSGPEITPELDLSIDEPLGLNFVWFSSLIPKIIEGHIDTQ